MNLIRRLALALALISILSLALSAEAGDRPNVVLIITDDNNYEGVIS